jgi:hypothetical protein
MNLQQLLQRLARGPVGDLKIGGDRSGTIPADEIPGMVEKAQAALTAMHTRFALSVKSLTLEMVDGLFVYPLRKEFAQTSGSTEINKFIKDSVGEPFTGDLIQIEHILDSARCELPLNIRGDCVSWFTIAYDTLSMDYPVAGDTYFVQYRADHATLDATGNLNTQNIRVPVALEEALLAKIGYEVFCTQTGESAAIKAAELQNKYEAACLEIELRNVTNSSVVEDRADQIAGGGWV